MNAGLTFKLACEEWEFDEISGLNYRTFVEEIPQHAENSSDTLVDKFHTENTYLICVQDGHLVGMIAVRDRRPFSLDQKLEDLDSYLPPAHSVCEIRLLAVEPGHRNGAIFRGLGRLLVQHSLKRGYDLAVISGTLRQEKLYRHLGFTPFGPVVGHGEALFQPMYMTPEAFQDVLPSFVRRPPSRPQVNLLPGPVAISARVREAFGEPPISHRSDSFQRELHRSKDLLRALTGSQRVEVLLGSGTLANDVIAAQLSLRNARGLILSNGEFGDRLIDHATRFGLGFNALRSDWGEDLAYEEARRQLATLPDIGWVWAVHCETSTGMLNDLEVLKHICMERGVRLCLDCISSIGAVPVDLSDVSLASGVSGKALGALPGLAMVFYDEEVMPSDRLPRYLDLGLYAAEEGVPFTHSSNLVHVLRVALEQSTTDGRNVSDLSLWLRSRLRDLGLELVAAERQSSPAVVTIALPDSTSSEEIGRRLEAAGFLLSYKSRYLLQRNWMQICLMGEYCVDSLGPLLGKLDELTGSESQR